MQTETVYTLTDGVQVRKEKFGLLFYNYSGPRLYFVPSKDLLDPEFFEGQLKTDELIKNIQTTHPWPLNWVEKWVGQVLTTLEDKGLINGQSIC
jgi:putative mycofactocin binding protein MftB